MMFLLSLFSSHLATENNLQRIDRYVWLALPKCSFFCMSTPMFIDILAGSLGIRYHTQTLFVVKVVLDSDFSG